MKDFLINNVFNSPHFIFIKCEKNKSDEVLGSLNLQHWVSMGALNTKPSIEITKRHFYTTWLDGWYHIMDDWDYTLWYNETLKSHLLKLSKEYEIFTCSIGDIDESFDFRLYRGGELIREFVVEDQKLSGGVIAKDFGEPLKGETTSLKIPDLTEKVISIAQDHGINTDHSLGEITAYCREELESEKFQFNEIEY